MDAPDGKTYISVNDFPNAEYQKQHRTAVRRVKAMAKTRGWEFVGGGGIGEFHAEDYLKKAVENAKLPLGTHVQGGVSNKNGLCKNCRTGGKRFRGKFGFIFDFADGVRFFIGGGL